jgi:enterochelin esterase-like enzyme
MRWRCVLTIVLMGCVSAGAAADAKVSPEALIELARNTGGSPELRDAVLASLPDAELKKGTAFVGVGPDFLCVVESDTAPTLYVDERAAGPMTKIAGANLWYALTTLATGTSHEYHFDVNGAKFGGRTDVPAYLPESYQHSGIPQGKLSEKLTHVSKIYEGMSSEYWIYVPAQYDPRTAAALMVWQDGQGHIQRDGGARTLNVIDNLTHQKRIPVMIQVFISPGKVGDKAMRSIEYDTMDDRYARFLRDEILAEVASQYNIRTDAYSRGITGSSSGGICAFNVAWRQPDQFSRVFSRIGSFTSIQWHPDQIDGGNVFPFMIRKQPKRNIRVWLQDGSDDLENEHGSWPLQNIQMANSLKMREYDFHLSFGNGTHNGAHGNAETPTALAWLWRDYDPATTEQAYTMDAAEKDKPYFRVTIHNR